MLANITTKQWNIRQVSSLFPLYGEKKCNLEFPMKEIMSLAKLHCITKKTAPLSCGKQMKKKEVQHLKGVEAKPKILSITGSFLL